MRLLENASFSCSQIFRFFSVLSIGINGVQFCIQWNAQHVLFVSLTAPKRFTPKGIYHKKQWMYIFMDLCIALACWRDKFEWFPTRYSYTFSVNICQRDLKNGVTFMKSPKWNKWRYISIHILGENIVPCPVRCIIIVVNKVKSIMYEGSKIPSNLFITTLMFFLNSYGQEVSWE